MQMAEKSRALTLLEKGDSVIAVARDIGVSTQAIYQLKRSAGWYRRGSQALAHLRRPRQERISF